MYHIVWIYCKNPRFYFLKRFFGLFAPALHGMILNSSPYERNQVGAS